MGRALLRGGVVRDFREKDAGIFGVGPPLPARRRAQHSTLPSPEFGNRRRGRLIAPGSRAAGGARKKGLNEIERCLGSVQSLFNSVQVAFMVFYAVSRSPGAREGLLVDFRIPARML